MIKYSLTMGNCTTREERAGTAEAIVSLEFCNFPLSLFICVAVAKLSKALAWLSCVRSRERPEF